MGIFGRLFSRKKDPRLSGPGGVRLSREQALQAVLIRNDAVTVDEKDSGDLVISIPILETRSFRLLAWFMRRASKDPVPTSRKIELDEIGSFVWRSCDGKTTVGQLVNKLSKKYKLPRKEAEYSTTLFIRELAKKHLIALDLAGVLAQKDAQAKPGG